MINKVVVITGASDGIGAAAARQLHAKKATVVITGRSEQKTKSIAQELNVPYYLADFTKLDDVRKLAAQLRKDYPRIDVLANNAGGIFGAIREVTVDGHEKTMQVNHLAHFLLTNLLVDILVKSKATVINTSSIANNDGRHIDIADLDLKKKYSAMRAYGNSKLVNILFTKELHKRYHSLGISSAVFHPGTVSSNFGADSTLFIRLCYSAPVKYLWGIIPPEKGADTLVWLASSKPDKEWESGGFYYKRKPAGRFITSKKSNDADLAALLWEKSEQMISK